MPQAMYKKEAPTYKAYHSARSRCNNPNTPHFECWGGRGIEFRFTSFEEFFQELGARPSRLHSVDRIDNDGHYEKGNVRWATLKEQHRNKRSAHILTVDGVSHCLVKWAELTGIQQSSIRARLKYGWCHRCSVTLPKNSSCLHKKINLTGE